MNTNNIFLSFILLVSLSFFASCAGDTTSSSTTTNTDDASALTIETSTPTIKVDSATIKKAVEEKEAELTAAKEEKDKAEKEKLASIEAEKLAKAKQKKDKAEEKRLAELKKKKAAADKKAAEAAANNTIAVTELPVSKPVIKPKPAPIKPKKQAKIKFDTKTHDFGTIKEGDVVKFEFDYTNEGTEDLVIKDASATCGCTAPGFSFFPLAPGLSSAISVTFNSANKAGAQRPEVTIITNGYPSKHVLTLEGVVEK